MHALKQGLPLLDVKGIQQKPVRKKKIITSPMIKKIKLNMMQNLHATWQK
jgi:hypothetical protein